MGIWIYLAYTCLATSFCFFEALKVYMYPILSYHQARLEGLERNKSSSILKFVM